MMILKMEHVDVDVLLFVGAKSRHRSSTAAQLTTTNGSTTTGSTTAAAGAYNYNY